MQLTGLIKINTIQYDSPQEIKKLIIFSKDENNFTRQSSQKLGPLLEKLDEK